MSDLNGKVALVTGGGQGLGRACATLLASAGAALVVADMNADGGEDAVATITPAAARRASSGRISPDPATSAPWWRPRGRPMAGSTAR